MSLFHVYFLLNSVLTILPAVYLLTQRCKAAKYCSKTCQVEHWRAGHKRECIDITKDQTSEILNRAQEFDELIDMIKKDAWESSKKKSEGN